MMESPTTLPIALCDVRILRPTYVTRSGLLLSSDDVIITNMIKL